MKCVRNLGAFFDSQLNMVDHISQITKAGYYHLRRLKSIRKFLTKEATERIVHAFITSKLDTNNGLLYGIDDCQLKTLEMLQNSAARLVTGAGKYDSITPILNNFIGCQLKLALYSRSFSMCTNVYMIWLQHT